MSSQTRSPRVVAIVQARMGSSRLPGKILLPLAGRSALSHVVSRIRAAGVFDDVVIATTTEPADDAVVAHAEELGASYFRGSEEDVLARYQGAAAAAHADVVVRITSDCPLLDPDVLREMVSRFFALRASGARVDMLTNARRRTYPRGLDVEVFAGAALNEAAAEATTPSQHEHVTPYLYEHPERFAIVDYVHGQDFSGYRLTLDTPDDYALLQHVFDAVPRDQVDALRLSALVQLLATHPDWVALNAHVPQKKS